MPLLHSRRRMLLFALATALCAVAAPSHADAQLPDLVLNVTDTPDPVPVTGTVTFAAVITNVGLGTATGVTYQMSVPVNTRYEGFTAGSGAICSGMTVGQLGPGTVSCTHPQLSPSATGSFSVLLRMLAQGNTIVASTVGSSQADAVPADNSVSNSTTVIAGADVAVTLTAPSTLPSGSAFSYALSLTNAGPDAATALRVQIPLQSGFTQQGALPAGCSLSGGTITCNVAGPIASGGTLSVGNISGLITAASPSTITTTASVAVQPGAPPLTARDPNDANNTSVRAIAVTAGSDVRLTKTRSVSGPYFVGNSFNFVLTAAYFGDSPTGLTITDNVPANYTIGTVASPQNGWSCAVTGQQVQCTRASGGAAGANQSLGSITIPVTINAAGANITNSATISATGPTDPTPSNNTATDGGATLQNPTADLVLSKSGPNPALVVQNVPFNWTLAVSSGGPSAFFGDLVITENIPADIRINSITLNGWSCGSTPVTGPATLTCTRTIPSGSPFTTGATPLTVVLNATALATGTITNSATLTTVNPNVADPSTGNNSATNIVTASAGPASADLSVIKTVDLANVPAGEVLTYSLEVVNSGTATATNITVTDVLGALINNGVGATGQGFISATVTRLGAAPTVTCTDASSGANSRTVSCTIPSLPVCTPASNCPIVQLAIRPGGNGGTRSNSASAVSSGIADPSTSNNTGSVSSTIDPRADVTVTKTASANPAAAGQALTYLVTAINNGPSQAQGVSIVDDLPLGVLFVSASPSSGSCTTPTANTVTTGGNRTITCALGAIDNGAQRTVTIIVRPTTATRGSNLQNGVTVSTTTTEPPSGAGNNSATRIVAVSNPSLDLLVNKIDSVDPLSVGSNTVYTITIDNNGPSDAENVVVRDTMPAAGLSYQSHTVGTGGSCSQFPNPNDVGGVLTCSIPRIGAGASAILTLTMAGVQKGVHTNRVTVESDETVAGFDITPSNNRAVQATSVRTFADVQVVSKVASVPTIAVRRPYSWVIKVRNNAGAGLAEADAVIVSDNLPAGMELTGTPTVALVAGTVSLNTCTGVAGQTSFTCELGTLSSGGEVDITVPVRTLTVPSGGTSTNSASVATSTQDNVPGNNSNSGAIAITGSSLNGLVYRDFNNNGTVDAGDTGIGTVTMTLSGSAFDGSAVSRTVTTAGDGTYAFVDLPEGSYSVQRGTLSESFLNVGIQSAGTSGGVATTPPSITTIALAPNTAASGYRFAIVPIPRLGLSKRVIGTPTANADGTLTAVLRVGARNFSLETLNAVTISDPLSGAAPLFGSFVSGGAAATLTAGSYTIDAAPSIEGSCATGAPTAAFDGNGTSQLAQIAALAAGVTCEFNVTLRYRPTNPLPAGNYTNQASGTGTGALSGQVQNDLSQNGANADPDSDGNPGNNNVPTPLNAVLVADVSTSVTLSATVAAGQPVAGTVLFQNLGPYWAQTVGYTLTLSPNLTNVTFGNLPTGATATYNASTGAVTLANVPATLTPGQIASGNGTSAITVGYTQNGAANSSLTSGISTSSNEGANVGPNSATATVTGAFSADVTTSLAFPATANAGAPVSGTVIFTNTGPSTASGMTYTLTLATGLTGVSFGNLPGGATATYNSGTGAVTLSGMPATLAIGAIASGNGTSGIVVNYTQNAVANSSVSSGIGTSTSQGANVAPDNATTPLTGILIADVTTSLTSPGNVNAGSLVNSTVLFTNNGPSVASGVTYGMTLTTGLTSVVFGNLPTGATAAYNSGTGIVTFAGMPTTLNSGAIASGNATTGITLSYTQPGTATSPITSVIGTSTNQGANAAPDNANTTTGGALLADVRAQVSFPTTVDAGQPVSGTVRFSNPGPSIASGVGYTLTLSAGLSNVVFGNVPTGATASYNPTTGVVTFLGMPTVLTVGQVASADGTTGITVSYTQNGVANSTINAAMSTTTSQGANVAPDNAAATVTGALLVDVTTTLTGFAGMVPPGASVTGRVEYRNASPSTAAGTTFSLQLSPGLSGVSFGNLPTGVTAMYNAGTGQVQFVGMPMSVPSGTIVSGDGVNGIQVMYVQPSTPTAINSTIGTTTSQGPNAQPDAARTDITALFGTDLVVSKTLALSEVGLGESVTYRVRMTNAGPLDVPAGAVLVDDPSTGLQLTAVACSTVAANRCTSAPELSDVRTGVALPSIAVNGVYELLLTALVTAPAGNSVSNAAEVSVPSGFRDVNPGNNRAVAGPTPVLTWPDLRLTKSASGVFRNGLSASYLFTVTNVGAVATTAPIRIVDVLNTSLTFQRGTGAGWSCSALQQTVTCTTSEPLAPGTSRTLALDVLISAAADGAIPNSANVTTAGDLRPRNDTSVISTPVVPGPDLIVLKSLDTDTLRLGATATYTLTVTNRGRSPTSEPITLTDDLPAGLVPLSTSGSDFPCTITGQRVSCTRTAPLTLGATASVTITVSIGTTLPLWPLANTACARTATDSNTGNDCGTVTTPVAGRRDAELRKDAPGSFAVGQPGVFRLVVRSRGTLPLTGPLSISDTLPRGLTFVSAQGPGWACGAAGNTVNCAAAGPIAVGDSAVVTVIATVGPDAFPEFTNCATLTAPAGTSLVNAGRSCVTLRPRNGPDLLLTKTVNTDTLRLGGNATWTLTIANRGAAATTLPITVTDTLPASLTALAATGPNFTCTIVGQVVQCTRTAPLAVNESVSIAVSTTVRSNAPLQPITNVACVRTADDVDAANDCGTVTTPVAGRLEASLRKEATGEFLVGEKGTFRMWVRNSGTVPLGGPLVVIDSLPKGMTFSSASGAGWSCTHTSNVVRCTNAGPLAVGDSSAIALQAIIGADAVPEATNCATVSIVTGAILTNDGRACVTVRPTADYRLVLELTTPRYLREIGESPDFTVLVRNVGRSPLPNVVITNLLPRGFSYVPGTSTRGGRPDLASRQPIANPAAGVGPSIAWPVGDMSPGQVIRLDYRARINAGATFASDNITRSSAASTVPGLRVESNAATVPIKLQRGLFDNRGIISGKISMQCDCDGVVGQGEGEVGIPGVRVVMEDGTGAITDAEGKYNILNVRAGLHVVKVDRTTLPAGATLVVLNTRNAGDANSRFVDLKAGEMHRADFAEGSRSIAVLTDVLKRRRQGEVSIAGDSARMSAALVSPLTFTPTAVTPLTSAAPTTSVYTPLALPNALHDGNSSLPAPPARAHAQLAGMPSDSGTGRRTVEPTLSRTGVDGQRLVPALRPMLATGLLQGRIDVRRLSRGALGLTGAGDSFEETLNDLVATRDSGSVRAGARGALLLKGDVKGAGLLTLSYDSERDRERTQFRDITPDNGFPIFGDASLREFDAQSQQRLYARLDRGASYIRYGDFATPRADDRRLLLAYDRSMTGLTYHAEGTRGVFNGFVSRNGIRQTVDELPGRGLSGPYYLAQPNAVVNSERIEIVTRDRNQPAIILRTQPMSRFEEYTIEPFTGRLLFRAPVPSMDANLNPVTIRVSYEVEQGGAQFNTYGGDGRVRLGSRLELGGFAVRDENPLDKQTLFGASATALLGASTTLLGEVARTETGAFALHGDAWRVELRHQSARVEGRVFAVQGDSTFANRSSTFVGGRTELGARWSAKVRTNLRLVAEALHTEDMRTDGQRDGALLSLEQRLSKRLVGEIGYRWANENGASVSPTIGSGFGAGGLFGGSVGSNGGGDINRNLTPLSFKAARARLTARVPGSERSSLFAEYEHGVDNERARRGAIGGEYMLLKQARLYLRHEWLSSSQGPYALSEGRNQQNTVFGIDADYLGNSKIFSEYRARDAFNGRDAEASIGLRNRWQLAPGVLANTTFERISPLAGAKTGRAFAATGGLEWTKSATWKGTSRLEWRTTPAGDNLLVSLGYAHKLSRDWTMLGRTLWDQMSTAQLRGRSQVGLAWRQTDRNRVNALFRLENRLDRTNALGEPTSRSVANVAAVLLNMQPIPRLTLSTRYAGKVADDARNGVTARSTAQLLMGRAILDLSRRFDLGVIGSAIGNRTFSERRYGVGGELGVVLMRNMRVAGGYNLFGFTDRDFEALGYTQRGPYVEIGFKFDEALFSKKKR